MMKQNKSRTAAYWQKRFSAVEQAGNDMSVQMVHEIEQKYERAMRQLQGKIEAWYGRFADNNGISMTEARKLLNQGELKELRWNVDQYIEYGKRNAIDGSWMKELENASAKFHISRLEALKLECRQQIEMAAGGLTDQLDTLLADAYKDGYYRSMFEVQKGTGVGFDVAKLDEKLVQKVIRKPWHVDGSDFSSSLWQNKAKLVGSVDQALTTMVLTGGKPKDAIKVIQKKMNTSEFNAKRLVLTEQAYFTSQAQQEVYKELDTEEVEIVAGLDKRTCSTCAERDGQHYPLNQMVAGVTCPPFYPLCRCTTVPYFDDDFTDGLRASRNEEGKTVYEVPENATYKDWMDGKYKIKQEQSTENQKNDTLYISSSEDKYKKSEAISRLNDFHNVEFKDSRKYPIDEKLMSKCVSWLDGFTEKYSDFMGRITKKLPIIENKTVSSMGSKLGSFSWYTSSKEVVGISLNGGYFSDYEGMKNYINSCKETEWTVSNAEVHKTFVHEYGHYVSHSLKCLNGEDWEDKFIHECIEEFKKVAPEYEHDTCVYMGKYVSRYGSTKNCELFAESFAEAFGGENPRTFAKIFGDKLHNVLRGV